MSKRINKFTKLFCVTICFILMFSITASASSIESPSDEKGITNTSVSPQGLDCPYGIFCLQSENSHVTVWSQAFRYSAISSTHHARFDQGYHMCIVCDRSVEFWDQAEDDWGPHTYTAYQDLGHQANGTHSYQRYCTVCGYPQSVTLACSGPPCVAPYSFEAKV